MQERVVFSATSQGMEPGRIAPVHLSPPHSRRRATLHAVNGGGRALIGFRERGSHRLVDVKECHVLAPQLFALIQPLRAYLSKRKGKFAAEIELALTDQGVDCAIKGITVEGLDQIEDLLDLCRDNQLARLSLDQGYGTEGFWEPEPVTVTLSGVAVPFPAGSFLQATKDGERALAAAAREWLGECENVADLFAGLGTFAFAFPATMQVSAYEAARDAVLACKTAAMRYRPNMSAHHRDLFRNPLRPAELAQFDGVVLDPPRAGARSQVEQLAQADVARIVYISCNPSSWARDCTLLTEAGYELAELRAVGQFRWSTHVELASLFLKSGK
ncbi:class I SAM-dependent RNA methyltransferase [Alteraurantiacibacter aestuarii]|uniref:class I SAM-dependent RNA methyltransferase n=1 Tax=Alteraurantiacibacter aestuarii TaxID=650004 RepID=UPI0031CE037D